MTQVQIRHDLSDTQEIPKSRSVLERIAAMNTFNLLCGAVMFGGAMDAIYQWWWGRFVVWGIALITVLGVSGLVLWALWLKVRK